MRDFRTHAGEERRRTGRGGNEYDGIRNDAVDVPGDPAGKEATAADATNGTAADAKEEQSRRVQSQ